MSSSVLCIVMYGTIKKKIMRYKFMRSVLGSHNSRKSHQEYTLDLTHKFVTLIVFMLLVRPASSKVKLNSQL